MEEQGATPANLSGRSAELVAKDRHSSAWAAPRLLPQKTPLRAMRGQVVDVRATMKAISGGSRDSEVNDWQAKPVGPASSVVAITVTPLAK